MFGVKREAKSSVSPIKLRMLKEAYHLTKLTLFLKTKDKISNLNRQMISLEFPLNEVSISTNESH